MTTPATVDDYIAALPERSRAILGRVRSTIRAAAPGATESISYGMPAFKDRGRILVYYAAFANHWSLLPRSKAVIDAHREELGSRVTGPGTIRFAYDEPFPTALVASIVADRLAENSARRDG